MNNTKNWYAVYTRPRAEKKVADALSKKKIENFSPINKVVRQWSDRKKIVYEPLFTSYVFVNVTEQELVTIKQTDGVINLVYWLNKPAIIRDAEIEAVKRFLTENENVKLERTPININDNVRILGGPLMEHEGQVLSTKSKTLKIYLPSMGYLMYAEIESSNVEVIAKTIPSIYTPLKMVK
jgi:transcription antitermination factor NusG